MEYRTVVTTTLRGLKQAERLHAAGWKMFRVGMFSTTFYRPTKPKRRKLDPVEKIARAVRASLRSQREE